MFERRSRPSIKTTSIETALIDDGLGSDPSDVYSYQWHNRLTRSRCKRVVRIEKVAEDIINIHLGRQHRPVSTFSDDVQDAFCSAIEKAIRDPEVVGFKSVICYRTGLAIRDISGESILAAFHRIKDTPRTEPFRLEDDVLCPNFVKLVAALLENHKCKKPFQFHTGLGDNDMNLDLSNPAHLQPFIEDNPDIVIILLHASYPFTTEAGYLATMYKNVYLDIGEVFPFLR